MIHGCKEWLDPEDEEAALEICPGVYVGTPEQFEKITDASASVHGRFRVFTGSSGWGPEQLEGVMEEGAWIVLPANGAIIFETPVQDLWERLAHADIAEPSTDD